MRRKHEVKAYGQIDKGQPVLSTLSNSNVLRGNPDARKHLENILLYVAAQLEDEADDEHDPSHNIPRRQPGVHIRGVEQRKREADTPHPDHLPGNATREGADGTHTLSSKARENQRNRQNRGADRGQGRVCNSKHHQQKAGTFLGGRKKTSTATMRNRFDTNTASTAKYALHPSLWHKTTRAVHERRHFSLDMGTPAA